MNLNEYLKLKYTMEIIPDEDGTFFAQIKELPGCMTVGKTPEEAVYLINEAKQLWLEAAIEDGAHIPVPSSDEFSGKLSLRLPKQLHKKISDYSNNEGVSINTLIITIIAEAVGIKAGKKPSKPDPIRSEFHSPAELKQGEYNVVDFPRQAKWKEDRNEG